MPAAAKPDFILHPRLAQDSASLGKFALCRVRLMDDRRWPWLILVPGRPGIVEWHDMSESEARSAAIEIRLASTALKAATRCRKINVGALGNVVAQMHIHVIARDEGDANWPGPVWGFAQRLAYGDIERAEIAARIRRQLVKTGVFRGDPV